MAIVSKTESNDNEYLHTNFFWTGVKKIFNYFTFFSEEECYLNLSAEIVR